MKIARVKTTLVLALILFFAAPTLALELRVPFDGAIVRNSQLLCVVMTLPETKFTFTLNGDPADVEITNVPGNDEDLHHMWIKLREGVNKLDWYNAETEKHIGSAEVVFIPPYSMKLAKGKDKTPYYFHTPDHEKNCSACHNLPEVFETIPGRPMTPAGKVCSACHPFIEEKQKKHEPSATYDCFRCHEPNYKPNRFRMVTSQVAVCGSCHNSFLAKLLGGEKHVHGPLAGGNCIICHDPHGGDSKSLTYESPIELCLRCHIDTIDQPYEKSLHGELDCTECHNPHGGATPILADAEGSFFCAECHGDVKGNSAGHPIAGHPVSAPTDPSKPGRSMNCMSCHSPHGMDDVSKWNIIEDEAAQRRFCIKCHY